MKVEHCEEDLDQNIAKYPGRCSYLIHMENNPSAEDLPGSDNDDEANVTDELELGDLEAEKRKLNAKLEFLDVMLQRVKDEERLRRPSVLPRHTYSSCVTTHGPNQFSDKYYETLTNPKSHILPSDDCLIEYPPLSDNGQVKTHTLENLNVDDSCLGRKGNNVKDPGESAPSLTAVVPKLDLTTAMSGISLDNLSIRELHDTFRATFGRETAVKDKQWLKRRISMGLRNTSMKTNAQGNPNSRHRKSSHEQFPTHSAHEQATESKVVVDSNDVEVARPLGFESLTGLFTDKVIKEELEMSNNEGMLGEEITRKRMRKPTRRYIEELSERDARLNSGKQAIVHKDSDNVHTEMKSRTRPYWDGFERMALVCREDSFGGCGIQIPFVFRVRRGRPRKNCSALLKHKSSDRVTKFVKKALRVQAARCSSSNADVKQIIPIEATQKFQVNDDNENKEHILVSVPTDSKYIMETSNSDANPDAIEDNSGKYVSTIQTVKGGIRRKHHRSWTLQEVVKLVEGVSRFGVGRWSDIRKLAFSSSGYRTSVDLKDKWRNLLRASYSQSQTKKESVSRRKHTSVPIPAPILVRVRELSSTQTQTQTSRFLSSSNSAGSNANIVHNNHPMLQNVDQK